MTFVYSGKEIYNLHLFFLKNYQRVSAADFSNLVLENNISLGFNPNC